MCVCVCIVCVCVSCLSCVSFVCVCVSGVSCVRILCGKRMRVCIGCEGLYEERVGDLRVGVDGVLGGCVCIVV